MVYRYPVCGLMSLTLQIHRIGPYSPGMEYSPTLIYNKITLKSIHSIAVVLQYITTGSNRVYPPVK